MIEPKQNPVQVAESEPKEVSRDKTNEERSAAKIQMDHTEAIPSKPTLYKQLAVLNHKFSETTEKISRA